MTEVWKDIPGYEGLYQVSDKGNVRSINWRNKGVIRDLRSREHPCGYRQVLLRANGITRMVTIHRLVASAFIPNPNNLPQVNHIDENKANNDVRNLEWCSASYNVKYSIYRHPERKHGTKQPAWKYGNEKIVQLDLNDNVVKVWGGTPELIRDTPWGVSNIVCCCNGGRKTAYGFRWRFANEYNR